MIETEVSATVLELVHTSLDELAQGAFKKARSAHGYVVTYLRSRDVTDVTVVGLATDYCVKATAFDAVRLGYNTTVDLEFCAGVTPETTKAAVSEMQAGGVCIKRSRRVSPS